MKHAETVEILRGWEKNKYFSQSGWLSTQAVACYMEHSRRLTGSSRGWASRTPTAEASWSTAWGGRLYQNPHSAPSTCKNITSGIGLGRGAWDFSSAQWQNSGDPASPDLLTQTCQLLVTNTKESMEKTDLGNVWKWRTEKITSVLGAAAVILLCHLSESGVNVSLHIRS